MADIDLATAITNAETEIARDKSVNSSATSLILFLAGQFEAVKDSPAKIQALVDTLREQNDSLASAVAANTPTTEPEPPASGSPVA